MTFRYETDDWQHEPSYHRPSCKPSEIGSGETGSEVTQPQHSRKYPQQQPPLHSLTPQDPPQLPLQTRLLPPQERSAVTGRHIQNAIIFLEGGDLRKYTIDSTVCIGFFCPVLFFFPIFSCVKFHSVLNLPKTKRLAT